MNEIEPLLLYDQVHQHWLPAVYVAARRSVESPLGTLGRTKLECGIHTVTQNTESSGAVP